MIKWDKMEILKYNASYFNSCVSLFMKVFNSPPWNDMWTFERASQRIIDCIDHPRFISFVVLLDEELIAAIFGYKKLWWNSDEFFIEEMFVDPLKQNKKYGTRLMDFLKEEMKRESISTITLFTSRAVPAMNFYSKNGFNILENMVFMKINI